jgi:bifunctional DNA-binding transcriptional regulator/antitoxin component of YhaV-PrlF toxin-antitoxin module
MNIQITKSSSKGQITIPSVWRKKQNTDSYIMELHDDQIILKPFVIEEVIFDSDRDNDGKGVSVAKMIELIKKIQNGQD